VSNASNSSETVFKARRVAEDRARLTQALIRTGRGDRSAFETLYRSTSAKLFGVCLRIFGERSDAEDALQDAYVTIWNKAASYDPARASPITWLVTVARNRAIDRLRASGKGGLAPLDDAAEVADPTPDAEQALLLRRETDALSGCIGALEARDAQFIRAAFLGGATYAELAEQERAPLGTVKSRIRRALLRLRECLDQ